MSCQASSARAVVVQNSRLSTKLIDSHCQFFHFTSRINRPCSICSSLDSSSSKGTGPEYIDRETGSSLNGSEHSYPWSARHILILVLENPRGIARSGSWPNLPKVLFWQRSFAGISGPPPFPSALSPPPPHPPPAYLSQILPKESFPGFIRRGSRFCHASAPRGGSCLFFFFFSQPNPTTQSSASLPAPPTMAWEVGGSVLEPTPLLSLREKWGPDGAGRVCCGFSPRSLRRARPDRWFWFPLPQKSSNGRKAHPNMFGRPGRWGCCWA